MDGQESENAMTEEEIQKNIEAAEEHHKQRRLTSDARAQIKKALIESALNEDLALSSSLEENLYTAQLECLRVGMQPPELNALFEHWTKLLYAGHFRRTG